ncbi:MAG: polyprenyl synthetase family protein [Candidatus Lokiarchaeota archaeon]|nr:polyprenyl synthetase family protein [Candidatus Lokiarchaeota archaeon]
MDFLESVSEEQAKIDLFLRRFFNKLVNKEDNFLLKDFYGRLRDFVLSTGLAKRIRPLVLIKTFTGIALDNKIEKYLDDIYELSIAVELLHNASIIHDDVVDQDQFRRGKPTFHRLYAEMFKNFNENHYGDFKWFGNAIAIHGGDACAFLGQNLIVESKFGATKKFAALWDYTEGMNGIAHGKIIEQYGQMKSLDNITLEDYLTVSEWKTSKQFETSASIGAALANSRLSQLKPLKQAMKYIGLAYQIQNDINDSFGNPELKSIDTDIKERRRTILLITAYHNAEKTQKKQINRILNSEEQLTKEQVDFIRSIIKSTGSLEFAKLYSKNMIQHAQQELDKIYPGLSENTTEFFQNLLEFIPNRYTTI